MAREDWQERDRDGRGGSPRDRDDFGQADYSESYGYDARRREGYRADEDIRRRVDDYGQADFSSDYAYDDGERRGFRRGRDDDREAVRDYGRRMDDGDYRSGDERRSFMDRASDFLSGRPQDRHHDTRTSRRRRGPSDRVLWAVIVERLEDERGLDLRDVDVIVEDGEVTLNGTVKRKADKRRIEDVADIDGVDHVQNNLRVRDRGHWTFL